MEVVSKVQPIQAPIEKVYAKVSDLKNIEEVKDKLGVGSLEIEIENSDVCHIQVPMMGKLLCRIVERTEPKEVKLQIESGSVPATIWVQLVSIDSASCKLRITLRAEVNPMIKMMIQKPIEQALGRLTDMLGQYHFHEE